MINVSKIEQSFQRKLENLGNYHAFVKIQSRFYFEQIIDFS